MQALALSDILGERAEVCYRPAGIGRRLQDGATILEGKMAVVSQTLAPMQKACIQHLHTGHEPIIPMTSRETNERRSGLGFFTDGTRQQSDASLMLLENPRIDLRYSDYPQDDDLLGYR